MRSARPCLLYTSDAADDLDRVDLGGRRIIKKVITAYAKAEAISACRNLGCEISLKKLLPVLYFFLC